MICNDEYSVENDQIIVYIFQNCRGIRPHELQLVDRPSIPVFIHHDPIEGTLSLLHSLEQTLLLQNLLEFELLVGLLRALQQYLHVLAELPQVLVEGVQHCQLLVEPLAEGEGDLKPLEAGFRAIEQEEHLSQLSVLVFDDCQVEFGFVDELADT
jgi:hypothetical protein